MGNNQKFGLLVELRSDVKKFQQGMGQAQGTLKKMTSQFSAMAKGMVAAFSIRAIGGFVKNILKLYDVQNKAEASLLTALQGREDSMKRLMVQARELQKVTLYGDEETIQAQALLASMGLEEEAIKRLIPLVQDFATMKEMKLSAAAELVSKSVGSSTNALARYGVEIEGAVGSSARLNSAVTNMTTKFKGQAIAAADAGTGGIQQLKMALDDVKETMGGVIIEATGVSDAASDLADKIGSVDWEKVADETAGFFERWAESLKETYKWTKYLIPGMNNLLITIGLVKNVLPKVGEEAIDYNTERTSIKAKDLPEIAPLPFMGGGAMTLQDAKEAHDALVKINELMAKQAGYANDMAVSTHEVTAAMRVFIPVMEEEANVIDGSEVAIQNYNDGLEEAKNHTVAMANLMVSAIAGITAGFVNMASTGKASMKSLLTVLVDTTAMVIQMYIAQSMAGIIKSAVNDPKTAILGPLVKLGIAAASVAGLQALWKTSIPEFAAGGIVSGETLARVGEYPGAKHNPEVIAPLSKLQDMLGGGHVEFEIRGDRLIGVLNNYSQRNKLMN